MSTTAEARPENLSRQVSAETDNLSDDGQFEDQQQRQPQPTRPLPRPRAQPREKQKQMQRRQPTAAPPPPSYTQQVAPNNMAANAPAENGSSGGNSGFGLYLALNLEVDITLKARIHGDLELTLL